MTNVIAGNKFDLKIRKNSYQY